MAPLDLQKLQEAYKNATTRLFFLDYDGTLAPICPKPEDATPSRELMNLLTTLSASTRNHIHIISGRDRKFLQNWVGDLPIGLSAEHGAFLKPIEQKDGAEWHDVVADHSFDMRWKEDVLSLFKKFCDKAPNAFVEKKEYTITLHYRNTSKEIVKPLKQELMKEIENLTTKYNALDVKKGKKSVEARIKGITKGFVIKEILNTRERSDVDFVVCLGDDVTDEDMFDTLAHEPELRNVFSCTVGKKAKSCSTSYLDEQSEVLELLKRLADVTTP